VGGGACRWEARRVATSSKGADHAVANESICLAEIILGGGNGTNAKATVQSVSVQSAGNAPQTWVFGSDPH
jgi:hypothetical protein